MRTDLTNHLRKAWAEIEREKLGEVARLQTRLKLIQEQKLNLALSLAQNPDLKDDIKDAINHKKAEIGDIQQALAEAQDIEKDFGSFATFALDFVDNLKEHWWDLDHEDRERCELLLFPERLRINHSGKVSTPKMSPIYRYKGNQKTPVGVLDSLYGGPSPKKLVGTLATRGRRYFQCYNRFCFHARATKRLSTIQ